MIGASHLEMENRRRPRAVYIVSEGGWIDTAAGVHKIRWLPQLGVPTIHVSVGAEPLSLEANRICVLTVPADGLEIVASDTFQALRARRDRRP